MGTLFERDAELDALAAAVDAATRGGGRLVVVEGPPGRGRSALLSAAAGAAADRGLRVLRARGRASEQDFGYGLTTQLLERVVLEGDEATRQARFRGAAELAAPLFGPHRPAGTLTDDDHFHLVHGLYWLLANLAEEQPLLLAVDDVHLADHQSLGQLLYLADRLDGLGGTLVVTTVATRWTDRRLLRLLGQPDARVLELPPLSARAIRGIIEAHYFQAPSDEFVEALRDASGGDALLVVELLTALDREVSTADAAALRELAVNAPRSVVAAVRRRLDDAGSDSLEVAQAASVLGDDAPASAVAEVAGLPTATAEKAVLALVASAVLATADPVGFATPMVAAAVAGTIPPERRPELQRRAAIAQLRLARPFAVIADHLLEVRPDGDDGVVSALWAGGCEALAAGLPDRAMRLLRRALAEPAPEEVRADLLVDLGAAEALAGAEGAVLHLEEAVRLHRSRTVRARAPAAAGRAVLAVGRYADAAAIAERAAAQNVEDADLDAEVRLLRFAAVQVHRRLRAEAGWAAAAVLADEPSLPRTPAARALLGRAALELTMRLQDVAGARATIRRLATQLSTVEDQPEPEAVAAVSLAFTWLGDPASGEAVIGPHMDRARARADLGVLNSLSTVRAIARWHLGDLAGVLDDTRGEGDVELWSQGGGRLAGQSIRARALAEQGELSAAGAVLDEMLDGGRWRRSIAAPLVLVTRGHLGNVLGQHEYALASYEEAGELAAAAGLHNPLPVPWRSGAALALARLGHHDRAAALAADEAAVGAEASLPGAEGRALWTAGLVAAQADATPILRRAVEVLDRSPSRLVRATAMLDLGTALLGRKHGKEAIERLQSAADAAEACGARRIADRARDELERAGVSGQRRPTRGRDLTGGEQRVVELAVAGNTNRQIAEQLFVSVKAVEWHLRNAYAKLGVANRAELAARFASEGTELEGLAPG